MVDDTHNGLWTYRRDVRIQRRVTELDGPASDVHHRVLAPEVQLLQKSAQPRPKDEADLLAVQPHLDTTQKSWLHSSLLLVAPNNPWLDRL